MPSRSRLTGVLVALVIVPLLAGCRSGGGSTGAGDPVTSPPGSQAAESPSASSGVQAQATRVASGAPSTSAGSVELSAAELVVVAEPAIVRIATPTGVGTGVIIGSAGEIVTNNHVVTDGLGRPADSINVLLSDGTSLSGSIVGRDPRSDLAILKIPGSGYSALPLGSLKDVVVGQDVVAIGFALDLGRGEGASFSVTRGIVSAKNRGIEESATILGAIQTDAAINPGNSGGPLINLKGEIVGINTAIAPDRVTGGVAVGIGFAVGVDTVRAVFEEIMVHGSVNRGLLGILEFEALRPAQARNLGLPEGTGGVYLDAQSDIGAGMAADRAGIRAGDVIISIDGYPIRTEGDLAVALIYAHAGQKVPVDVFRNGSKITVEVTLGAPGV